MQSILLVIHLLLSVSLIVLILLQHGKGADAGAAFGSGASATVFGAQGSTSFMSRTTAILATLFFTVSLALAILAHRNTDESQDLADKYQTPASQTEAAVPAAVAPETDVPPIPSSEDAATGQAVTGSDAMATDKPPVSTQVPVEPAAETDTPAAPAE